MCIHDGTLECMKDAAIRIRVEKELRASFAEACLADKRQASEVLREFMKAYVERYRQGQRELFPHHPGRH